MAARRRWALGGLMLAFAVLVLVFTGEGDRPDHGDRGDRDPEQAAAASAQAAGSEGDGARLGARARHALADDWRGDLAHAQAGRVEGRVIDEVSGEPVPGVTVLFRQRFGEAEATSGGDGRYSLKLPIGNYEVRALGDGVIGAGLPRLHIWRVAEAVTFDVPVMRLARVSGVVVDASGRPVADAQVSAELPSRELRFYVSMGELGTAVTTDATGAFELDVVAGDVTLVATAGQRRAQAFVASLFPGARRSGVRIAFGAGGRVAGVVRGPDGEVVAGAEVQATSRRADAPGRHVVRATTDATGRFAIEAITPGVVSLEARAEPFAPSEPLQFSLAAGDDRRDLALALQAPQVVSGRVIDEAGAAIAEARILAKRVNSFGNYRETLSTADGSFAIEAAGSGPLSLVVRKRGYAAFRSKSIQAPASDLEITLGRHGTIRGLVTDGSGAPVRGFTVEVVRFVPAGGAVPRPGGARARFFDDDGRFELEQLQPGSYDIRVSARELAPTLRRAIEVPAGGFGDGSVELRGGARATGSVVDADTGAPIGGARIRFPGHADVFSGPDGAFAIDHVAAGRHSVTIAHPDYLPLVRGGVVLTPDAPASLALSLTRRGERSETAREIVGIGIAIGNRSSTFEIRRVFAGTPAAAAGIRARDRIVAIDGEAVRGLRHGDVIGRLRGAAGTTVRVTVERKGVRLQLELVRARLTYSPLSYSVVG